MKHIKRLLFILILIAIVVTGVYINKGYNLYKTAIEKEPIEEVVKQIQEDEDFVAIEDIPKNYVNAVIAVEDRRFYKHNGVDIISIGRAVFTDIKNMKLVEGGSTITQQVAKNNLFTQEKKLERKIAEIFASFDLEKICTKDEIFELYVNTCYYGEGFYSIKDAAEGYFGKEPKDMNLYECTLLAGIPNAPSVYAPTKNPELARERQAQVISKMIKNKYLTVEQAKSIGF